MNYDNVLIEIQKEAIAERDRQIEFLRKSLESSQKLVLTLAESESLGFHKDTEVENLKAMIIFLQSEVDRLSKNGENNV